MRNEHTKDEPKKAHAYIIKNRIVRLDRRWSFFGREKFSSHLKFIESELENSRANGKGNE